MCGRMGLTRPELIDWSQFGVVEAPIVEAHYNIPPGTDVLAIRERAGRRVAEPAHWGLIPSFAKDPTIGNRMAIARGDTAFERPAFRRAIMARRCLIPVPTEACHTSNVHTHATRAKGRQGETGRPFDVFGSLLSANKTI